VGSSYGTEGDHHRGPGSDHRSSSSALLELAVELGNVSEACRQMGASRTRYYEWKQLVEVHDLDALTPKDRRRPQEPETPTSVVAELLSIAAVEPAIGCRQYADRLAHRSYGIGDTTVQKILVDHGLGHRHQRVARAAIAAVTRGVLTEAACEDEPFGFCDYSPAPGGLITRWAIVLLVLGTPTAPLVMSRDTPDNPNQRLTVVPSRRRQGPTVASTTTVAPAGATGTTSPSIGRPSTRSDHVPPGAGVVRTLMR
jgi:hypothetical protein